MKCDELKNLARRGLLQAKLAEPDVRAHLSECAACDALYARDAQVAHVLVGATAGLTDRDVGGFGFDFGDLEALRGQLNKQVAEETANPANVLRDRPTGTRRAVVLGAVLVLFGLCLALSARGDLLDYPLPRLAVEVVLLFTLVGAAVWDGTRPLTEPLRSRKGSRVILTLCIAAPVVLAVGSSLLPVSDTSGTAGLASIGRCMLWGTAVALPAACVLWFSKRKNPLEEARVPLLAATLGLVGNLLLQIHCPSSEFLHLISAHAPLLLVFALGIGIMGRILARRSTALQRD